MSVGVTLAQDGPSPHPILIADAASWVNITGLKPLTGTGSGPLAVGRSSSMGSQRFTWAVLANKVSLSPALNEPSPSLEP